MPVDLLVITDGRDDELDRTIRSAHQMLYGDLGQLWIFDDTGRVSHRVVLGQRYPDFNVIGGPDRRGFGGAIQNAWEILRKHSSASHIFHLEGDFTFNRSVPVWDMIELLEANPWLAQVALRRQAWNPAEIEAGGVVEADPEAFEDCVYVSPGRAVHFLTHDKFFTTNPCLYRRSLVEHGWPSGPESEGHMTSLLRNLGLRFAYLGRREDQPWVHHIGAQRVGTGY